MISAPLAPAAPKPKKNVPRPGNPLKSFNWSKLPDAKLHGTIWQELDDTKLYNAMDLHTIDKMFCAYQKNGVQVCIYYTIFFLVLFFLLVQYRLQYIYKEKDTNKIVLMCTLAIIASHKLFKSTKFYVSRARKCFTEWRIGRGLEAVGVKAAYQNTDRDRR